MRINGNNPATPSTPPTNPYHIARAYGVQPPASAGAAQASGVAAARPVGSEQPTSARSEGVRKLVAGVVPGGVAFDAGGGAQPAAAALPMYRHPADKNAAATAVTVGRSLDVRG
jgi:hypothetical protein